MGEKSVLAGNSDTERKAFTRHLLNDIKALEEMLRSGMFETGIQRIGAEQEFCLVDSSWRPAPLSIEVLERINDSKYFTTELARYNIEINLDPIEFTGDCFEKMEGQLRELLEKAKGAAKDFDARILLTGILPSIRRSELELDYMTPHPRYQALNEVMTQAKGGEFEFHISGTDELITRHNTVLFEACNTSFQIHLQTEPDQFVSQYNWAQAVSGPLLAAMTNSPLLLGKRLWAETRIALFQQSLDLRQPSVQSRESSPRVYFGEHWMENSVIESFQEDIARYKLLIGTPLKENSWDVLKEGGIPKLKALMTHNGTIYKWNRPCYGVTNGKPHLRIEARYIPAGPTVVDEMANTAFWLGVMRGMPEKYANVSEIMDFDDAKRNFFRAARMGVGTQFKWIGGKKVAANDLILNEMIPIAREGLEKANIQDKDINRYLGIIEARVREERTGAHWLIETYESLKKERGKDEAIVCVTAGSYNRQETGSPVHEWDMARPEEGGSWLNRFHRVDQIMSTDLFTVQEEDLMDLVGNIMVWRKIRHLPVENHSGELVGLVTSGLMMHYLCEDRTEDVRDLSVGEVMIKDIVSINPEASTRDAMKLMRQKNVGCLPVIKDKQLVGIVTEFDFVKVMDQLFDELLKD